MGAPLGPRTDGFVYFAQSLQLGWVKIGWAKCIARRLVEIASYCRTDLTLLGCFAGSGRDEHAEQLRFRPHRVCDEWFEPADDLVAYARALASPVQVSLVLARRADCAYLRSRATRHVDGAERANAARRRWARERAARGVVAGPGS